MSDKQLLGVTVKWILGTQFNDRISWLQPIYEAITNALEAEATIIDIIIKTSPPVQGIDEKAIEKIESITIKDNGTGFDEKNINSFNELGSDFKAALGCKGIGRFTWLKVFDYVDITSVSETTKVNFRFDLKFNDTTIRPEYVKSSQSGTNITFGRFRNDFLMKYDKKPANSDRRIDANAEEIFSSIEIHLWIKLKKMIEKGDYFNINIFVGERKKIICPGFLKPLEVKEFRLNSFLESYDFYVYYTLISKQTLKGVGFNSSINYCASGRSVRTSKIKIPKINDSDMLLVFVTSNYLDNNVNQNRLKFDIIENNPDSQESCITMSMIENELESLLYDIIKKYIPNLDIANEKIKNACIDEYPHLSQFIREQKVIIADKKNIIKSAKLKYERFKDDVKVKFDKAYRNALSDRDSLFESIDEINQLQALELAEYIKFRDDMICGLQRLVDENNTVEKYLHNIFMKMKTDTVSLETESKSSYLNNIWLLDDKFMSYCYAASDVKIKQVAKALQDFDYDGQHSGRAPDMLLFYSKPENEAKDIILIEFKAIGASRSEKSRATTEIMEYASIVKENLGLVNNMWVYIITNIDDNIGEIFKMHGFKEQFSNSNKTKIYHQYLPYSEANAYIISVDSIIKDASARNNVFLNILKQTYEA